MMLCRFVFAFWWSVFVVGIWFHLNEPLHVWTIDRHPTKIVRISKTIRPIEFKNASVLWIDMLTDSIQLNLQRTVSNNLGHVGIKHAEMQVFENDFGDNIMEVYSLGVTNVSLEDSQIEIKGDDIHLSPFRRIFIFPSIDWTVGSSEVPDFERAGHFKDGKWYEGRDSTQLGFGALFAWCMGVVFLVVMRRKSGTVVVKRIVVKRKKRIFK
jgi:hypothetical protein